MDSSSPLIFIYQSEFPPQYINASLDLSKRFSQKNSIFIAPQSFLDHLIFDGEVVALESFYNHEAGDVLAARLLTKDPNPLWRTSVERFEILRQFVMLRKLESFFHAETDCLLFDLDLLEIALQVSGFKGMFVPFDSDVRAVASLLFVNRATVIEDFVQYAKKQTFSNDMGLIAQFASVKPDLVIGMPTIELLQNPQLLSKLAIPFVSPKTTGMLVDSASLGQWLAGVDRRNLRRFQVPKNHFVNENIPNIERFSSYDYSWDQRYPVLSEPDGRPYRIHVLHLHSKIHEQLVRSRSLERLIKIANRNKSSFTSGWFSFTLKRSAGYLLRRLKEAVRPSASKG